MIGGHQLTICWHVDDLFIANKDPQCVTDILDWLQTQYDTPAKLLKATCGHLHDYLGMNVNFATPGEVTLT